MKKNLLIAIAILFFSEVNAQKGSVLVYGSIEYQSSKTAASVKQSSFEFIPGIGYQFNRNWTLGITANISEEKFNYPLNPTFKSNTWAVGPFIRYTHVLSDLFSVYGQLDGGYLGGKLPNGPFAPEKVSGGFVEFFPAIFINIKKNFGLNFNIGGISYQGTKTKQTNEEGHQFSIGFGKTASIGVSKNF